MRIITMPRTKSMASSRRRAATGTEVPTAGGDAEVVTIGCIIVARSGVTMSARRPRRSLPMARVSLLVLAGALVLTAAGGALLAQGPDPNTPKAPIPEGFTEIFNGKDLAGWHVSRTNHHGTMPLFRVLDGVLVGTQDPPGKGGILLTDKKYKNVEVFLEIKPDWGCDGGLFLSSSEAGEAYQVTLDYLPGGGMGGIYGERLTGVGGPPPSPSPDMTPEQRAARAEQFRTRNQA